MTALVLASLLSAAQAAPVLPKDHLAVPLAAQAASYSCGAASLLSVLWYWKAYDGSETGLYARLETTPKDGTEPAKIVEAARSLGLKADLREGLTIDDLRLGLKAGDTIILDIQAWRDAKSTMAWADTWEEGHYVVLIGMDKTNAYVMDPSAYGAYAYIPLEELEDRWHDYEDRHGAVRRYTRMGIDIRGKHHIESLPAPLIRVQ